MDLPAGKLAPEHIHHCPNRTTVATCGTPITDGRPGTRHRREATCPNCGDGYPTPLPVKRPNGRPLSPLMATILAEAAMHRQKRVPAGASVNITAPLVTDGYLTPGPDNRITAAGHQALAKAFPAAPLGITKKSMTEAATRATTTLGLPGHLQVVPEQTTQWFPNAAGLLEVPEVWLYRWTCLAGNCHTSSDAHESIWEAAREAEEHTRDVIACMHARTRAEQERR